MTEIPCGTDDWTDCIFFDPDVCLTGQCTLEDQPWDEDCAYEEDDAPEYSFVFYDYLK